MLCAVMLPWILIPCDILTIGNEGITLSSFAVAFGDQSNCWDSVVSNLDVHRCLGVVLWFKKCNKLCLL